MLRSVTLSIVSLSLSPCVNAQPAGVEYFERKIRPIFAAHCASCHGGKAHLAGLNLTDPDGILRGADTGPVIVKGDPAKSRLIAAVNYSGPIKMPPTGKLDPAGVEALTAWVAMGAPLPAGAAASPPAAHARPTGKRGHWAFQPVKNIAAPPPVRNRKWVRTPIDSFILAKLEENDIEPAPPADKPTLLRRAKYDLHGLPPTEQEIGEFRADRSPGAFASLVDRLLSSPRYGEKWGRNWLDVARYGDSTGLDEDNRLPHSWRYRDYVIDAFNRDLPFDNFIREQIMGDLMPAPHPGEVNTRGIVATGFLALGPKPLAQPDKVRQLYDVVDEQIDTVSKAFMGLTIACARCHDHKFDPITAKDYYSLASIFASTRYYETIEGILSSIYLEPLVPKDSYRVYKQGQDGVRSIERRIDAIVEPEVARYVARQFQPRLADYMVAARSVYRDGKSSGSVARECSLDDGVLKKWVDYLNPKNDFRPCLQKWHDAGAATLREAAAEYQRMYETVAGQWSGTMDDWLGRLDAALKEGKTPPGKPNFDMQEFGKPEARFFGDVAFQDGPFALTGKDRDAVLSNETRDRVAVLRGQVEEAKKTAPPEPPMANAAAEGASVEQTVFIRGSHHNAGPVVPKQFPVVLAGDRQTPIAQGSGRKELAGWLTRPDHPLVARVMVNRIWLWHFGEGIVRTPDNFGLMGERPTHPELLDYLAARFIESGWSVKSMHRLLMLSSVYQMGSAASAQANEKDPGNRLRSRQSRRRITIEEMRDSFLALDSSLDFTMGGTLASGLRGDRYEKRDSVNPDKIKRRSVYLPIIRNKLPNTLRLFDFVDATTVTGKRVESNIAPQALYLMNSEFVSERSRSFAAHLLSLPAADETARLALAYRIALARNPDAEEAAAGLDYLQRHPKAGRAGAWQSICRVLMASNEFHYVE